MDLPTPRPNSYRHPDYDYTQPGAYFLTLCAYRHEPIFGAVRNGIVHLSACGRIVHSEWLKTPTLRPHVVLDCFVVMPNHFHALLFITEPPAVPPPPHRGSYRVQGALGSLVAGFKSAVTRRGRAAGYRTDRPIWQRNYYDHVVRDRADFERIQEYILTNPAKWELDRYYP